jgi:hydrogenase nickel incorporation protein HypA/HybF
MHELSIAQSLIDVALTHAERHGARRIVRIECRIGCLRQVDATLLREAFEIARASTIAAEATLEVTTIGVHLACHACGLSADVTGWAFECPTCGSTDVTLSSGEDLELTRLELEVPDEDRGPAKEHLDDQRTGRRTEPQPA